MDWIPRTVRQRQRKIDDAIKSVEMRTGKNASDEELAAELKISEEELCSWQSQLKVTNIVSLDDRQKLRQRLMDAAKSLKLDTIYLMQQREGV